MSLIDALLLDPAPFEVWIAFRGQKGTGTLNDPYGADTTAKFDAVMNSVAAMAMPNTLVHLGPGTFTTAGYTDSAPSAGWQIQPGMKIVGAGIGATTLKLDGPSGTNAHFFAIAHRLNDGAGTPSSTPVSLAHVADLTIDCNLPNTTDTVACGAIRLMGDHVRIRNVRAINWGSRSSIQPCFVFSLITGDRSAGISAPLDAGMEACIADIPSANNTGNIFVLHAGGNGYSAVVPEAFGQVPFIRNCYVDGGSTALTANIRGLSMNWCKGGVVEGNQVQNIQIGGPYIENATCRDLIVRGNTYKNVNRGPHFKVGTQSAPSSVSLSALIRDTTYDSSGKTALATTSASDHGLVAGDRVKITEGTGTPSQYFGVFVIKNVPALNQFRYVMDSNPGSNPSTPLPKWQKLFGLANLLVENNVIELAPATSGDVIAIHIDDTKSDGATTLDTPDYDCLEAIIRENRIRYFNGQFESSYVGTGVKLSGVKNVMMQNNVLEIAPVNPLKDFRCGTVNYFNNKTPAGALIQGLNGLDTTKYSELETEAEDALVLTLL